jgi:hypothetical protein
MASPMDSLHSGEPNIKTVLGVARSGSVGAWLPLWAHSFQVSQTLRQFWEWLSHEMLEHGFPYGLTPSGEPNIQTVLGVAQSKSVGVVWLPLWTHSFQVIIVSTQLQIPSP